MATLIELFENNQYGSIVSEWEEKQYQVSTDPEAAYVVAAAHFRLGNYENACGICEELEGALNNNANFLSMYAAILRRLMLHERAEVVFKQALEISPDAKDVRNNYTN